MYATFVLFVITLLLILQVFVLLMFMCTLYPEKS